MSRNNERLQRPAGPRAAAAEGLAALDACAVAQQPSVGGRLCFDFANTTGGWAAADRGTAWVPRDDRLTTYTELVAWARALGLANDVRATRLLRTAAQREPEARAVLARARALRQAIYRTTRRLAEGARPLDSDVRLLDEELRTARHHERLASSDRGLAWVCDDDESALDAVLWAVARSAAETLTAADPTRLRVCPGAECGWLFEDTSRNRSRRWCRMADCGNLDKVRRFRTRQATG